MYAPIRSHIAKLLHACEKLPRSDPQPGRDNRSCLDIIAIVDYNPQGQRGDHPTVRRRLERMKERNGNV